MIERRGFMKVLAALAASTGIVQYAEAKVLMPEHGDWIEDRGDYYIVRIPDGKTFAGETLGKPTIFGFGRDARLENVTVNGFVNMYMPQRGSVYGSTFDAYSCAMPGRRAIALIDAGNGSRFERCDFRGPKGGIPCGIEFLPSKEQVTNALITGKPIQYTSFPA